VAGTVRGVGRRRTRPEGAPEGTHVVVLPVPCSRADARELDLRFDAGYNLYRALYVYGRKRLTLMRQSRAWRPACRMPCATKDQPAARSGAPDQVCADFGVTQKQFTTHAKGCRKGSGCDHVDSARRRGAQPVRDAPWVLRRRCATAERTGRSPSCRLASHSR
jgi:hypothetical protein